jgi:hypothetical protein
MPGTTPWQQTYTTVSSAFVTIVANTETVIATLTGISSRSPGSPILLSGYAFYLVNAATTLTTLRVRQTSLTGALVQGSAPGMGATAASQTSSNQEVVVQDSPMGEVSNMTYVLTIQSTAAGANWNVALATLTALV